MPKTELAPSSPVRALALSGGGFRATLFHLGVVRYLRDSGRLASVRHVSGVSGGAVIAAHLVCRWADYTGEDGDFEAAAKELIALTKRNVRGRILLAWPFQTLVNLFRLVLRLILAPLGAIPVVGRPLRARRLERLLRHRTRSDLLERKLRSLFKGRDLRDIRSTDSKLVVPDLHLLATNLSQGGAASFSSVERTGKREVAYLWEENPGSEGQEAELDCIQCDHLPIERAVACSAAFPGVFPPRLLEAEDLGLGSEHGVRHLLTDGGVFDNLGVRMLGRVAGGVGSYDELLVSDAGAPLVADETADVKNSMLLWQLKRAVAVLLGRVGTLEKWAHRNRASEVGLTEADGGGGGRRAIRFIELASIHPTRGEVDLEDREQRLLAYLRTDLDRFTDMEINLLAWHGQRVAKHVLEPPERFADQGGTDGVPSPWTPVESGSWWRTQAGGVKTLLRARVRRQLQRGQRPRLSSFVVPKDPRTYLLLLGLLAAFGALWVFSEPWRMTRNLEDPKWRVFDVRGQRQNAAASEWCSAGEQPVLRSGPVVDAEALCALERSERVQGVAILRLSDIEAQQYLEGQLDLETREPEEQATAWPFGGSKRISAAGVSSVDRVENRVRLRVRQLLKEGCRDGARRSLVGVLSLDDQRFVPARLERCRFSEALTVTLFEDREAEFPLLTLELAPRKLPPLVRQLVGWVEPGLERWWPRTRVAAVVEQPGSRLQEPPDPWELELAAWSDRGGRLADSDLRGPCPEPTTSPQRDAAPETALPVDSDMGSPSEAPEYESAEVGPAASVVIAETIADTALAQEGARLEEVRTETQHGEVTVTIDSVTVSDCVGWRCRLRFDLWQGSYQPAGGDVLKSEKTIAARYQRRFVDLDHSVGPLKLRANGGSVLLRVVQINGDDEVPATPIVVDLGSSGPQHELMKDPKNDLLVWVSFRTSVASQGLAEGERGD